MAQSVNERLLHEAILHALSLQRLSNGTVRKLLTILNVSYARIGEELISALSRLPADAFTVARLEGLLDAVKNVNALAHERFEKTLGREMRALSDYELDYQRQLFESVLPARVIIELPLARVNPEQVYAGMMAKPFQGRLLKEWASQQSLSTLNRVRDTVRIGYVEQRTTDQIVRDIRGTRAGRYQDGVLAIDRRNAEAIVRTALGHTSGFARDEFYAQNEDLVKDVQWISTLDSRTSEPCILRDKKLYTAADHTPKGHRLPWGSGPGRFHWNCRSTSVPVVKSFREMGLGIDEFNSSTRASVDGQVAGDLSYGEWLKRQPASVQDDVLGATRGALLRRGDLDVSKFANDKGRWLSIDELRAKDKKAFAKAGVE